MPLQAGPVLFPVPVQSVQETILEDLIPQELPIGYMHQLPRLRLGEQTRKIGIALRLSLGDYPHRLQLAGTRCLDVESRSRFAANRGEHGELIAA